MKKINITLPSSWNELSPRQLKTIAGLFHEQLTPELFDAYIFFILMDARWWQLRKRYKLRVVMRNVGMSELKKHYDWLYTKSDLTNFIPTLQSKTQPLYAPLPRLLNATIDEFAHTEDLFLGFNKAKDISYLRYLAAVLYRELADTPGNTTKRVPFEKNELDARAAQLAKIDANTLYAILLSYQGCRNYMYSRFPTVFPRHAQDDKAPAMQAPSSSNLGKLILAMSGAKFGTHNETKATNLYIFLTEFEEQLKAAKAFNKNKKQHA